MEMIDLEAVAGLLEQVDLRLKQFKKDTYEESFADFMDTNRSLWDSFRVVFEQEEEPVETEEGVADTLVKKTQEILDMQTGRIHREKMQLNINLYMVSYVFPAMLACQIFPNKDGNACKMAEAVCRKWKESFPQYTISYSDYASIQAGFKQKLCYITTAVCESLHKPQDCWEIMLMKNYRDEYLLKQEDGEEIVREYYDIAPTIIKRIEKGEAPDKKYQYLWERYLKKCVELMETGRYEECGEIYKQMVEELRKEYLITSI